MNDLSEPELINSNRPGEIVEVYQKNGPHLHYTRRKNGDDHWTMRQDGETLGRVSPVDDARVQPPQY